eukprot:s111_g39.t1
MADVPPDVPMDDAQEEAFGDDNATSALAPVRGKAKPGAGRGRAKAKAKVKAKAKSAGRCESAASGRRQPVTSCVCPGCPFPKYQGSRFCSEADHKKAWDNMVYQRRSRKDISEEDKQNFDESMKDDLMGLQERLFLISAKTTPLR